MHKLQITARLNEEVDAEGVGFPKSVTVTNAGFLAPSALAAIAQEVLDSYTGEAFGPYVALMPDWDMRSDSIDIKVVNRRV